MANLPDINNFFENKVIAEFHLVDLFFKSASAGGGGFRVGGIVKGERVVKPSRPKVLLL